MKNLHILSTDKPSRLSKQLDNPLELYKNYIENQKFGRWSINQNIYITSDEEIKEGDWVIHNTFNSYPLKFERKDGDAVMLSRIDLDNCSRLSLKDCKKIILTTDQDLIKDSVQAIPDEFLEWFVKNLSCEEATIHTLVHKNHFGFDKDKIVYKIIIPQEEPKQYCENCKQTISKYGCACGKQKEEPKQHVELINNNIEEFDEAVKKSKQKPKQETIEEAANIFLSNTKQEFYFKKGSLLWKYLISLIEFGANWQAERMYSEEEVITLLNKHHNAVLNEEYDDGVLNDKEWFEQFKKK